MKKSMCALVALSMVTAVSLTGCLTPVVPVVLDFTEVTEDMTLLAGTYLADQSISISGGTLTLSPGVVIKFASGEGLNVYENGSLNAVGTEDKPILLTGQEATEGFWTGLRFIYSNSASNQLKYVTVEYGGNYWEANLSVNGDTRLAVNNCIFQHSSKHGFRFDSGSTIQFTNNTSTLNVSSAGSVAVEHLGILGNGTYSGNTSDVVLVDGGSVDAEATWGKLDVPYEMTDSVYIEVPVTIAAGARFLFAAGAGLNVNENGSLSAVGTAASRIVFSSTDKTRGYWTGVRFYYSNSSSNRLEYVTIEYGGDYWEANLSVNGNTRLAVSNCIFRDSSEHGFRFDSGSTIQFSNNTSTSNATSAGSVALEHTGVLGGGTYTGNDNDVILVDGGTLNDDTTWAALGVPYMLMDSATTDAALTVDPGVVVVFDSGEGLSINETGSLTAVGTAANPILFTGADPTPGFWSGIHFYYSNDLANQLEYVTVEYAGNYWDANISVGGTSRVNITNCTLTDSSGWGIDVSSSADINADVATANTFANNVDGDVQGI